MTAGKLLHASSTYILVLWSNGHLDFLSYVEHGVASCFIRLLIDSMC